MDIRIIINNNNEWWPVCSVFITMEVFVWCGNRFIDEKRKRRKPNSSHNVYH